MQLLKSFSTSRVSVFVYDTQQTFFNESIYCITSRNLSTDRILIRFGTFAQIQSILSTYLPKGKFTL